MATNDKTARETTLEEIKEKIKENLKEENLRRAKESSWEWYESVHGAIQAINTADDLNSQSKPATAPQKPSQPSAKEALAVYKTLSEKEWQQYFGLLDTKNLGQDLSEQLRKRRKRTLFASFGARNHSTRQAHYLFLNARRLERIKKDECRGCCSLFNQTYSFITGPHSFRHSLS